MTTQFSRLQNPFSFQTWIDDNRSLLKPPVSNKVIFKDSNRFDFQEFEDYIDEQGNLELENGAFINFELAKRNAFDSIYIWSLDSQNKRVDILLIESA